MIDSKRLYIRSLTRTALVFFIVSLWCALVATYTAWRPTMFDLSYSEDRWRTLTLSSGCIALAYVDSSGPPNLRPLTGSTERSFSWAVFNDRAAVFKTILQSHQSARDNEARRRGRAIEPDMYFIRRLRARLLPAFDDQIRDRAIAGFYVHATIAPVTQCVVRLPLPALAAALAIYPAKLLLRQHRRLARARDGQCIYCGYCLYGVSCARCPECGGPATTCGAMPLDGDRT